MDSSHQPSPDDVTEVSFLVDATPVPQPRQKFSAVVMGGKAKAVGYTETKHGIHGFKYAVREAAKLAMNGAAPFEGPLHIGISFVLSRPQTLCRKKDFPGRLPCDKRKGDVDNFAKGVMDCCNGLVYVDDSQVWSLFVTKELAAIGENPSTLVLIRRTPIPDITLLGNFNGEERPRESGPRRGEISGDQTVLPAP